MALKHVNAVVVGAGAGGGVVAKELATAGLSVVLLERGKWYSAADCRKDDLRNQRTSVLGNAFGPDEERNPRVLVDERGERVVLARAKAATATTRPAWAAERSATARMAWRYMEKDFRMRSTYGAVAGSTLEDWPISYADLEPYYEKAEWEIGVSGDDSEQHLHGAAPQAAAHAAASAEPGIPDAAAGRPAPGPAPVRYSDAAQHRSLQRAPALHAMPLVRGVRLRSERANRHAQHRDSRGAGHRQLRAAHRVHGARDSSGRPRPRHRRGLFRCATTGCRSRPPTW